MRILFDECAPRPLKRELADYGQFSRHIMEFEQGGESREIDRLKAQKKS